MSIPPVLPPLLTTAPSESAQSPGAAPLLSLVDPNSLDELLNRDPLTLSDAELDALIAGFRAERVSFLQAEAEAKAAGKKRISAAPKSDVAKIAASLTLEDLLGAKP